MPFCVAGIPIGTYEMGALGAYQVLHSIVLELHIPFVFSWRPAEKAALQYADTVRKHPCRPTFWRHNRHVADIYTFGMMRWGGFEPSVFAGHD